MTIQGTWQVLIRKVLGVIGGLLLGLFSEARAAAQANENATANLPAQARRVLFLGDSITYGGTYIVFLESYFLTRHPEQIREFLNLGLPSETVSGLSEEGHAGGKFPRPVLSERLQRVLLATRPDLVVACYGMNDGIYLPFDEERFTRFKRGMEDLHREVRARGAAILHVTPPTFDEVKGGHAGYSAVLDKYSQWLLAERHQAGWDVVDLHGPMDLYLAQRRQRDPQFAYAADGVHANEVGQWIIAREILWHWGARDVASAENGSAMLARFPHSKELLDLIQKREEIRRDAWLTATRHKRPGLSIGLPLPEAQAKERELDKQIRELVEPGH